MYEKDGPERQRAQSQEKPPKGKIREEEEDPLAVLFEAEEEARAAQAARVQAEQVRLEALWQARKEERKARTARIEEVVRTNIPVLFDALSGEDFPDQTEIVFTLPQKAPIIDLVNIDAAPRLKGILAALNEQLRTAGHIQEFIPAKTLFAFILESYGINPRQLAQPNAGLLITREGRHVQCRLIFPKEVGHFRAPKVTKIAINP